MLRNGSSHFEEGWTLSFEAVKDILVVSYALSMATVYAFSEGYFGYLLMPLMLAATWEALGWEGKRSVTTLILVVAAMSLALVVRILRGAPLWNETPANSRVAFGILVGVFGLLIVGVVVPLSLH